MPSTGTSAGVRDTCRSSKLAERRGEDAALLAGGQSLVPLMRTRTTAPAVVIDLNAVDELNHMDADGSALRIGSMVRQSTVEKSPVVMEACPLVSQATSLIGSPAIRNRGTVGGSLAFGNPAGELPAAALALGATITLASVDGQRSCEAAEFFVGAFKTDIRPGEILVEASFPVIADDTGWSILETGPRLGDPPVAGAVCGVSLSPYRSIDDVRIVVYGVAETPVRLPDMEDALRGHPGDSGPPIDWPSATAGLQTNGDMRATPEFRRHLAAVLLERAFSEALAQAGARHAKS